MREPVIRLRKPAATEHERLEGIVHFAHRLTNAVYRREPESARASVNLLVHSFGVALGLDHNQVKEIVERSLHDSQDVFAAMGVPLDRLRLKRQIEAALVEVAPVAGTLAITGVPR